MCLATPLSMSTPFISLFVSLYVSVCHTLCLSISLSLYICPSLCLSLSLLCLSLYLYVSLIVISVCLFPDCNYFRGKNDVGDSRVDKRKLKNFRACKNEFRGSISAQMQHRRFSLKLQIGRILL